MNKGKRFISCPECKRKRYCSNERIPNHNFRWTCSKGHSWIETGITVNRIASAMEDYLLPNIKTLFERDDIFFNELKRRR